MTTHIAPLKIGRPLHALDDPRMAGFMNNLVPVTDVLAESESPVLSVWESRRSSVSLRRSTSSSTIARAGWFEKLARRISSCGRFAPRHIPDLAEAKARLDHLTKHGDSDVAFGWSHLPHIKLWMSRKCG